MNELETIHEHEAMDFTPASSAANGAQPGAPGTDNRQEGTDSVDCGLQSDDTTNSNSCLSELEKTAEVKPSTSASTGSLSAQSSMEDASDSQTSSSDSMGENLHALPL